MARGATRTWVPPQRGPKESADSYVRKLQARINEMEKSLRYETRDRKMVLGHRIETCEKAQIEAIRGKK